MGVLIARHPLRA